MIWNEDGRETKADADTAHDGRGSSRMSAYGT